MTTRYSSPGAAVGLSSYVHGTLVDSVSHGEADARVKKVSGGTTT